MSESRCLDGCEYRTLCEEEFGEYNVNGDDFRAVEGTHFCRLSWKGCCKCVDKQLEKENMFVI
jgi:hypothetical protein